MMQPGDVAHAAEGFDAVFLVTSMGLKNDPASEIDAARHVLEGLQAAGVTHLVYTSCLGVDHKYDVSIRDILTVCEQCPKCRR